MFGEKKRKERKKARKGKTFRCLLFFFFDRVVSFLYATRLRPPWKGPRDIVPIMRGKCLVLSHACVPPPSSPGRGRPPETAADRSLTENIPSPARARFTRERKRERAALKLSRINSISGLAAPAAAFPAPPGDVDKEFQIDRSFFSCRSERRNARQETLAVYDEVVYISGVTEATSRRALNRATPIKVTPSRVPVVVLRDAVNADRVNRNVGGSFALTRPKRRREVIRGNRFT